MNATVSTTSLALLDTHQHCLPDDRTITAVLDHTDSRVPANRPTDLRPLALTLAAVNDACQPCQNGMSSWLAQHGDPWTIVRLAGPVATDAGWLARHWRRSPGRPRPSVRDLLSYAFSSDVATVVGIVATRRDLTPAVKVIQALRPVRRYQLVQAILHGIADRVPAGLVPDIATVHVADSERDVSPA